MSILVPSLDSSQTSRKAILLTTQDDSISQTVAAERTRLRRFIARYVVDREEAEDILQDVFYELVDAYRLMTPIERAGAWLLRVARNRIVDRFRKKRPQGLSGEIVADESGELFTWDEFLPDAAAGPEETLTRQLMLQQIETALAKLPALQREVFIAHELEGRSFKEISAQMKVSVNTLLARKHAAVTALRKHLRAVYDDLTGMGE